MSNVDIEIEEIKKVFKLSGAKIFIEGGVRFIFLPSFFKVSDNERLDCIFSYDPFLGYPSRLWFPKIIATKEQRNWNGQNVYIDGSTWFAFSMTGVGKTLIEILMSHVLGAR
jgi:hypothetical protein